MSGGIAALSVGFGEYLGSFFRSSSRRRTSSCSAPIGPWRWTLNGEAARGVGAILVLTVVNQIRVKEGAWVRNGLTLLSSAGSRSSSWPQWPGPLRSRWPRVRSRPTRSPGSAWHHDRRPLDLTSGWYGAPRSRPVR